MSQGAILVKRGVNDVLNVPGGVGTLDSPGRRFSFVTSPGTIGRMLVLPPASLERAGRALLGDNFKLSEDISFDMRNAAGRAVVRNTSAIFQELGELEQSGLSHLAAQSYAELLLNLAIAHHASRSAA